MGASYTSSIADAEVDGTMVGSHLNTPEDIKRMPYFPTGTKSLLNKCLTKEIWEQCKSLFLLINMQLLNWGQEMFQIN